MKCKLIVFLDKSTVILLYTYYNYNKIEKKIDDILNKIKKYNKKC